MHSRNFRHRKFPETLHGPFSSFRHLSKYPKGEGATKMSKLNGKVAVVTGASKGIGASIAEHLAAEGASVVVNYSSSKQGADEVVGRIAKKGGKAVAIQANVSQPDDVRRLFQETKKAYG